MAVQEKEGELATMSLEFEYLHQKSRCEMLISRGDISNDIMWISNSRDVVASSPSFSCPTARVPRRACLQAGISMAYPTSCCQ